MIEHIEKELRRYVIATFLNPTTYVVCNGNCSYSFVDNIQYASKFASSIDAEEVRRSIMNNYDMTLVTVPMVVRYILIEEE